MEYYSALKRNEFDSVLIRWMNLEPIIQGDGKGGTNGEGSMDTYTLSHVKRRADGDLVYASGSSNRGSVTP